MVCEVKKGVYWVGAVDEKLRNFHGYLTQRGTTYNAYLIVDEKVVLIDTVKAPFYEEMMQRVSEIIDPAKIDIIVSNHVEMDHSGGLPMFLAKYPDVEIYCSEQGAKGLKKHYKQEWNFRTVKSGDSLKIGRRELQFLCTPMVHWPDNMVTYCPEDKILFSNDSFGQHLASLERFDDEYDKEKLMHEAKKYYANIVMPYGMMVQRELAAAANFSIETICPSHGLIWRKYLGEIIDQYTSWAAHQTTEKAVIVYDTMWGSTKKIAEKIAAEFAAKNIKALLFDLQEIHISDIMTEVLDAKYICVGSPTLNNNILPTVAAFLTYLKGLEPKKRIGQAFGSYGWSGQSIGQIEEVLKKLSFELLPQIKVEYIP